MDKTGLAVVGCGRISKAHLTAIAGLNNMIDLVATVDINEEAARNACEEYASKRYYASDNEAFADPDIEAVVLCLPHDVHAEVAVEAARAGKHILVEKPMALTLAEADAMIGAAEDSGVNLMVGQVLRHAPGVVKAKESFDEGKLGKPLHVIERRLGYVAKPPTDWWRSARRAGGLITGLNIPHSADAILWILNASPTSVYAVGNSNNPEWEGEDDVMVQLVTSDGTIVSMNHSFNSHASVGPEAFMIGTKSTFFFSNSSFSINNEEVEIRKSDLTDVFEDQMKEFVGSINEKREPLASGRDVRKVVAVIEAARESMKRELPIDISDW